MSNFWIVVRGWFRAQPRAVRVWIGVCGVVSAALGLALGGRLATLFLASLGL
jgi:uncharacterized membrane protein